MVKVGDYVVYATSGVCKISHTEKKTVGINEVEYFVLKPLYNQNATVFVPTSGEKLLARMKPLLNKKEIEKLIDDIVAGEPIWFDSDTLRRDEYKKIISEGERLKLGLIIKALYLHRERQIKNNKKLHISDEKVLSEAEKILFEEISFVTDTKKEDVIKSIAQALLI